MARPILGPASTMGPQPPMVGRSSERVLLSEQLSAMRAGRGNVVIIGGEAGIGKTTLARSLLAQGRPGDFATVSGHCHDLMATAPYGLWLDLADRYRHAPPHANAPPLPAELASDEMGEIRSQSALFGHVTDFLRDLAEILPTVVVLEDVHWADPASLELLRYLAARIAHLPLLVLVTYRVDELTRQNPFYQQLPALVRESEGLRLNLQPLTDDELGQLVRATYALPEREQHRLVTHLAAYTDGNPFFAVELLRALEEQQGNGLTRSGDRWVLGDIDRIVVPAIVRQVIDARVNRLGEHARLPLTTAAVVGHRVQLDLVAELAQMPADEIYDVFDRAIEHHVLTPTPDGAGIQFAHALTREALYASIPPHRRVAVHTAVAEALARRPQPVADDIAWHYQQAGDDRAPQWLIKAGVRAQRAYAWLTARDHFEAAARLLEGVPGEERTRAQLLYLCGKLLRYSDPDSATHFLDDARDLAERIGDRLMAADATMTKGVAQAFAGNLAEGLRNQLPAVDAMLALPARESYIQIEPGSSGWMADVLPSTTPRPQLDATSSLTALGVNRCISLAWWFAASGRLADANHLVERYGHLTADRALGPVANASIGHYAIGRGILRTLLGDPHGARDAFSDAFDAYRLTDHHACIAFTSTYLLLDLLVPYFTADVSERRRVADLAAHAIEEARGALPGDIEPDLARLPFMLLVGQWREAREIADRGTTLGPMVLRRAMIRAIAPMARAMGEPDVAMTIVTDLLPDGCDAELGATNLLDTLAMQRLAARIALDAGNTACARAWLEANDRWLAWSGSVLGHADNLLAWAGFHHAGNTPSRAKELAERAVSAATDPDQPLVQIEAHRLLGTLALEAHDWHAAEFRLTAALSLADACATPYERALTLIACAGRPDADAASLLAEARETCEQLGATPALAQIDSLAATRTRRGVNAPAGLTAREMEVLRLVARGLTDAQIGDELCISYRTVGHHLRSIYNKLDVHSRTQAVRAAIDHGIT